jgi:hypothetical protein
MATNPVNLPSYVKNSVQENYHEELNETLREWFNSDSFFQPSLTNAQVTALLALTPAIEPCRTWFNTDLGKLQILVAVGTVETVTST